MAVADGAVVVAVVVDAAMEMKVSMAYILHGNNLMHLYCTLHVHHSLHGHRTLHEERSVCIPLELKPASCKFVIGCVQ